MGPSFHESSLIVPEFAGIAGCVDDGEPENFPRPRRRFGEGSVMQGGCVRARGQSTLRAQGPEGLTRGADITGAEEEEGVNGGNQC